MKESKRANTPIEEIGYIKLDVLKYLLGKVNKSILTNLKENVLYTGTGRAALRMILEYYTQNKNLTNRNDQVLVPQWMCQSVLYSMNRFCNPCLKMSSDVKGVLAYHQYGFPQKIDEIYDFCEDKELFLIEDCANVYESYYKGKLLGTFGDSAIFSFSKMFPSVLGGALVTKNKEIYNFGIEKQAKSSKVILNTVYCSKMFYECLKDTVLENIAKTIQEMAYAVSDSAYNIKDLSLRIVNQQIKNKAMERRKENYQFVLEFFDKKPEYFEYLEKRGVVPYVVPLFDKEKNLKKMIESLKKINVTTGVYHFDVNRNVLSPNFKKCMWIPIHQEISKEMLESICNAISKSNR